MRSSFITFFSSYPRFLIGIHPIIINLIIYTKQKAVNNNYFAHLDVKNTAYPFIYNKVIYHEKYQIGDDFYRVNQLRLKSQRFLKLLQVKNLQIDKSDFEITNMNLQNFLSKLKWEVNDDLISDIPSHFLSRVKYLKFMNPLSRDIFYQLPQIQNLEILYNSDQVFIRLNLMRENFENLKSIYIENQSEMYAFHSLLEDIYQLKGVQKMFLRVFLEREKLSDLKKLVLRYFNKDHIEFSIQKVSFYPNSWKQQIIMAYSHDISSQPISEENKIKFIFIKHSSKAKSNAIKQ